MNEFRKAAFEIEQEEFKKIGYQLIDDICKLNTDMGKNPVTKGEPPAAIQELIKKHSFSEEGNSASELMQDATRLLFEHSLFNGHPKFMGYITASPAPIGVLGELLAAAVNPNAGAYILSPMATEIEKQTISWLAQFIGVPDSYGGILVSGGNMANFTAFLTARTAKAPKELKEKGILGLEKELMVYCSKTTHTWIEKAAVLFGHGTKSVRWIPTDVDNKMDISILNQTITDDISSGKQPFMVVGTAGDVSTGVVDELDKIALCCKAHDLWFHIDGAYGAPAAIVPAMASIFKGLSEADSIAIDPHKWLYSPLEAGCTLVKDPKHLIDTYSSHPEYYNFGNDNTEQNFYEYGLQNSRGFRALKVWLMLQQIGRQGYAKLIAEDIELAQLLYRFAEEHNRLQAITNNLSITTFRYIPNNSNPADMETEKYLNQLNETLVNTLQAKGELFLSNAVIAGRYCLRTCIVNFRTSKKDIREMVETIVKEGDRLHASMSLSQDTGDQK